LCKETKIIYSIIKKQDIRAAYQQSSDLNPKLWIHALINYRYLLQNDRQRTKNQKWKNDGDAIFAIAIQEKFQLISPNKNI